MRLCLYLGTRGCPRILEDALEASFEPLTILVPVEPELLGPNTDHQALQPGLERLAELLAQKALTLAQQEAKRQTQPLTDVFNQDPAEASAPLEAHVLEPPWLDALARHAADDSIEACYIARDALEILDEAGIRPGDVLDEAGLPLTTR